MEEYLKKLNKEQYEAVICESSVMVLAAAGSGKTSTLTSKIAYLIKEKKVHPQHILAVTFTNKAAKEMSNRLSKMDVDINNLWIGTFHGISNKILKYHYNEVGLQKNFYIMDSNEQLSYIKRMMRNEGYDVKILQPCDVQDMINGYKDSGIRAIELKNNSKERELYELYQKYCHNDNCVDFGELMLLSYELLRDNESINEYYSTKFKYVLIDEFQDTSELQYKWIKELSKRYKNVFAVGDDDQCVEENTEIDTPNGVKKINTLKIGDEIYTKIGENKVVSKISSIFSNKVKDIDLLEIVTDNKRVVCTKTHNWFVLNDDLEKYDVVYITTCKNFDKYSFKNTPIHEMKLKLIKNNHLDKYIELGFEQKDGWLVYETKSFALIEDMVEIIKDFEIIEDVVYFGNISAYKTKQIMTSKLKEGMFLVADNKLEQIKQINTVETDAVVYDINVQNTYNFIANGLVSHNSIYSFRGAKPENINLFKKEYAAKILKIEQNYRSDANILNAANSVIKNNKNRQGKNLIPTKENKELIKLFEAFNDAEESAFIGAQIKSYRRYGVPYREMAVLYRTNGQSRSIEKALITQNIPYVVYGGFRFFDRQEVKHAMAYLRLAHNPNDNMAFLRVVNIPSRAIGEASIKKLDEEAKNSNQSLYETVINNSNLKIKNKFMPFVELIDKLKKGCENKKLSEKVEIIIKHSGLEEMYENDKKEGEDRLDNLYELLSAAEVFQNENKDSSIDEFLSYSTLDSDMETKKRNNNIDAVKLMTVHASKGLEFEVVFISGLEESLFPHANSFGDNEAIEEERRLMYVALTRAKKYLYLSHSEERLLHGQRNMMVTSRFLKEIPKELLVRVS